MKRPRRKAVMMLVRVNVAENTPAAAVRDLVRMRISNQAFTWLQQGKRMEDAMTAVAVHPAPAGTRLIGRRQP